jgi:hypothetical protein
MLRYIYINSFIKHNLNLVEKITPGSNAILRVTARRFENHVRKTLNLGARFCQRRGRRKGRREFVPLGGIDAPRSELKKPIPLSLPPNLLFENRKSWYLVCKPKEAPRAGKAEGGKGCGERIFVPGGQCN